MNRIIENNYKSAAPEIGMGATMLGWTDRHPYTVIAISKSGKTITIQADKAIRTDSNGMSEMQHYTYERNPEGYVCKIRFNVKRGQWVKSGSGDYHPVVMLGKREEYYDYSF